MPQNNTEKINLYQLNQLFEGLKLISPPPEENKQQQGTKNKDKGNEFNPKLQESLLRQQEKKLINKIWENLKDEEGNINTNHLFLLLLAILNLYEFYLYSSYKKAHKSELSGTLQTEQSAEVPAPKKNPEDVVLTEGTITEFNNTENQEQILNTQGTIGSGSIPNSKKKKEKSRSRSKEKVEEKSKKEIEKEQILNRIKTDINNKVKTAKKYCSFDNDNMFILSFNNAKLINNDFCLFYVNWSSDIYSSWKNSNLEGNRNKYNNQNSFKPIIDGKSAKIFNEYRRKVQTSCKF